MYKLLLVAALGMVVPQSDAYKVFLWFPFPGRSITSLGDGIARHLLNAGHEVTYVTAFPKTLKPMTGLREIDASFLVDMVPDGMVNIKSIMDKEAAVTDRTIIFRKLLAMQMDIFELESLKAIFNDPNEKFDVVITGWMYIEVHIAMSVIFDCPFIWVSTIDPNWMILRLIDEIPNPAYNPDLLSTNIPPLTFTQRVQELVTVLGITAIKYFSLNSLEQQEYERYFVPFIKKRGRAVPPFEELRYSASLILGNSHISLGHSVRLPQNYACVGGYHIDDEVKPLPEDLQKLLDNSKHGLIYFSMGSNLRSKHLPDELKRNLLKMFGKLKQTVLWKFEEDLPNRPSNVRITPWAPQQSILAHPKCVLFITHGGLLSTTETIYFGKPIIGIPVMADQFTNVQRAMKRGYAKMVELSYTMTEELENAIHDILGDPSYAARAKERSAIYHDRPIAPGKELVHWVEHVVRTGGAPHLRSPALLVPWYQKAYLDLALIVLLILYLVQIIVKKLFRILFSRKKEKTN